MGRALNIVANAAVAAAAVAIFGPVGGFTLPGIGQIGLGASIGLAAFGSPALGAVSVPLPSDRECRSSTPR